MFTVALHCQIMTQLGLKYLSHNLHVNCVIGFFPYLILYACIQTFDVMGKKSFCFGKTLSKQGTLFCIHPPGMPRKCTLEMKTDKIRSELEMKMDKIRSETSSIIFVFIFFSRNRIRNRKPGYENGIEYYRI